MQALTAKQAMFVKEYLTDLNMTQAAIRAGYSAKTAEAAGCRLFRDVKIQAAIKEAMQERSERVKVTADDVAQELKHLGFSNIQDLFDEAGNLMDIRKLPRHVSASIKSVKINLTETVLTVKQVRAPKSSQSSDKDHGGREYSRLLADRNCQQLIQASH